MKIHQLHKLTRLQLVTCRPDDTVQHVASLLADEHIGAVPVVRGDKLVGILSERDICRGLGRRGAVVGSLEVRELMTKDVAVCHPDDRVQDAGKLMLERHIRHLPIVRDGDIIGMISLRDVLAAEVEEARLEANVLRDYARSRA